MIGKLPILSKRGFTLPNYNYCGPYNPLNKQVIYENGNIIKYIQKPIGKTDEICGKHDIDYELSKNINDKHNADKKMINSINKLPYKDKQQGTFLVKNIINTKQKLGMGNNFTMEDLSEELNEPVIHKFKRKKAIVNYIDHIHSADLVDMRMYSKINKGYKGYNKGYNYIFINIDVFSKYAWAFPIKAKKMQYVKLCYQKIFKERKPNYLWTDKEPAFFSKEMLKYFEDNNVTIYYTNSHLKAVNIERFNRSLRKLMMKEFVKNNNAVWYNILSNLIKTCNYRYHSTIKMKPIEVNKLNEKYIKQTSYTYNKTNIIPKYEINDLVRISLKRRDIFDKPSGNINWSEELFKTYDINISDVIMYKLKDVNDEIIEGSFYEKELQKTENTTGEYIIEKIIKTKNNKIYVKWRGYNNSFNSWIDKNNIIKYIKI